MLKRILTGVVERMNKTVSTFLLVFVLFMGLAAGESVQAQDSNEEEQIVLTEFSDYQCPACAAYHPVVEKLKEDFGERLKVEYRHFPLNSHRYSFLAARAAEAAKNQGKFLEMHNKLFDNQHTWSRSGNPQVIFVNYAREIGLDLDRFKDDLNSGDTQKKVMEEKKRGQTLGVNATPTFFIDGEKVENNPQSYEMFIQLIESKLEAIQGG